jgi:hypothetical protein
VLGRASSEVGSRGLAWTRTKGHAFAISSRNAASTASVWTAAKTRAIARFSSKAASGGLAWSLTRGHTLALRSRDAALIGSSWTAAQARVIARASLATASDGATWTRARAEDIRLGLEHAHSIASPRLRAGVQAASARLLTFSAEAGQIAERQREQAAFLAMRLNAQVKGEIDALKRATREGRLMPPSWHRVSAIAFAHRGSANGGETKEAPGAPREAREAMFRNEERGSRNALVCVEPWRSRLPVVQSEGSRSLTHG